jgi:putative isomerase
MPKSIKPAENRPEDSPKNSMKPLLAQFTILAYEYSGDTNILNEAYDSIKRHCHHWEITQQKKFGLFTFRSHRGSGVDDHPAVFCRPFNSSADVYLNSMFVKEYEAAAEIAGILEKKEDQLSWLQKKEKLAGNINNYLWDPTDSMYYNIDVGYADPGRVNTEVRWPVPLKIRSWTSFMPLWAGIADEEKARLCIENHLLNPDEFWTANGIRSLAQNEPAYEIKISSNPSCWRGPVWVVNNFMIWEGLLNYGHKKEASELAAGIKRMLTEDIQSNQCLHEYYDPETGKGLTHPGFLNWNTLAAIM